MFIFIFLVIEFSCEGGKFGIWLVIELNILFKVGELGWLYDSWSVIIYFIF